MALDPVELNKSILLLNENGEGKTYSPEELMTLRLNTWTGWRCSAGFENIHIGPDGQVTGAACAQPCYIGNIFKGPLNFPDDWLTCTVKWCMCGSAMRLRKVKTDDLRKNLDHQNLLDQVKTPLKSADQASMVTSPFLDMVHRYPKNVTWDISRRCNFSCSYCHPSVSNHTDPLRSRDQVFEAVFKIIHGFGKRERISWVFTGGEPTLHSFYDELCEILIDKQHAVHTQTNASRQASYYGKLIRHSSIGVSAHLEFLTVEKVLEVAKAVIETKKVDEVASRHWFGIRIMTPPGKLQQARAMMQALESMPEFSDHGLVFYSATYERDRRDEMMVYEENELQEILARS